MRVAIGDYVSDGNRRTISLGFRPKQVFIKAEGTTNLAQRSDHIWAARTNVLAASDSFLDGVGFFGEQMLIGVDATINTSGTRYHWCALGEDGAEDFETVSYMGNATAGHVVNTRIRKQPLAVLTKRDSTLAAVLKVPGVTVTADATGTALAECYSAIEAGALTLTAVDNVNQYTTGGMGEGIDSLVLYGGNAKVVTWASGTSGGFIDCGGDPLAALIFRTDTTGIPAHFVTRNMPDAYPVNTDAKATSTATLVPGGIVLGSSTTLRTGTFYALVFCRKDTTAKVSPPQIIVRERKAVYLPGRGTAAKVDCGTSDATLKIDGAISIEWNGVVWHDQYNSESHAHLLERGIGPAATPGAYSWGVLGVSKKDSSWSGPQLACIPTNDFGDAAPLNTSVWRTGIVMPYGLPFQMTAVHEGNGRWLMYLNGVLVKQRRINLATNILSGAGHRTQFGARRNTADTADTQYQKMAILSARVYSAALSSSQVASRFVRELMGSTETDITSNLAELWDARNASGTSLPASVNSANNGTISAAGRVITL